jgi:hypothetical protein
MRVLGLLVSVAMAIGSTSVNAQEIDWKKIDDTLGRSAVVTRDVHRYGFPRSDLRVTLDGVESNRHSRSAAGSRSNGAMRGQ